MDIPCELLNLAAKQHGVLSRSQLTDMGATDTHVLRWTRRGVLNRVGHRTLVVAGSPATEAQRAVAACLETGGVLSHRSAARFHGLGRFAPLRPPEVTARRSGSDYRLPVAHVHTTTWLPPDDHLVIDGIGVLSVARTLFSLAGSVSQGIPVSTTRQLVDQAIRERKATDAWLWSRLEAIRRRGRRGVSVLEGILTARSGRPTESWLEGAFLDLLMAADIPLPACQQRIGQRGAFLARVDFLYAGSNIVIEVSGSEGHASADQRAGDAHRRNELQLRGFRVLEFTYVDIVETPQAVVAEVRRALDTWRFPIAI